jgi:hypothetical protein
MKSPDSFLFQVSYKLADVPFRAMKSLSKAVIKSVLPDAKIHKVSLHEGSLGGEAWAYAFTLFLGQRAASVFYVWAAESESSKNF